VWISEEVFLVAMLGFHEVGSPCTTLVKREACDSYSFHTRDVWGDKGRAE